MARFCTTEDVERYRELLLDVGVVIELPSEKAYRDLCNRLADPKRYPNEAMRNLVAQSFFYLESQDRYFLALPPDKEILSEVRTAIGADRDHWRLSDSVTEAAKEAGIKLPGGMCVRSPCGGDAEVSPTEVDAARLLVGTPKARVRRPHPNWPLVVSYGLGVDSTALLVGLAQLVKEGRDEFRPEIILFADVGGEKDETYAYLAKFNRWLDSVGFPKVQIVAWATEHTAKGYGSARTLEQQCLINQTMPSISASKFGSSKCSVLWKQDVMNRWMELESGLLEQIRGEGWITEHGSKIVKAIGYDATETNRAKKGTFRVDQELMSLKDKGRKPIYDYWYPLQEWKWSRARCIAEIEAEIGSAPPKSSCFFCGAMTKPEIKALPKDLLMRALLIEAVANHGRHRAVQNWGLGVRDGPTRPGKWIDFAREEGLVTAADLAKLERQVETVLAAAPDGKGGEVGAQEAMKRIPAFSDVRGFRGRRLPIWDRGAILSETEPS
jgi:hypothetical protein